MANYHLAILKKPYLERILSGRKQIELRLTRTRRAPFGRIAAGDEVFLKQSSGPVCAIATVGKIRTFENLTPQRILRLRRQYNHKIGGDDGCWQNKKNCRFALLIWLEDVRAIGPVRIDKKDWRAWVVLTDKKHFGLLKLLPQNRPGPDTCA